MLAIHIVHTINDIRIKLEEICADEFSEAGRNEVKWALEHLDRARELYLVEWEEQAKTIEVR